MNTERHPTTPDMKTDAAAFGTHALSSWRSGLLRAAQSLPANWFGRRAALLLRKCVLKGGPRVIDADVEGLHYRLHMRDNVSERKYLFMPQFFDVYERRLLRESLRPGDVFVDIGANAGIYSLAAAAAVGSTGRVLAVEPNPRMVERLTLNLSLNGFLDRAILEQAAVSDRPGQFELTLDDTNLGGASLLNRGSGASLKVRCELLTDLLARHDITRIDALKIDIEGAEDRALAPFFATAPEALHPRIIIIENSTQDWQQDLPAIFIAAGYRLLRQTRMNLVYQKPSAR
ncbi:MAG: FkbM family methyltransferase [Gammaproteobacteria bacterium]|nr:FkbM family methyltransferase [Gammaproteobacteria bacterium]